MKGAKVQWIQWCHNRGDSLAAFHPRWPCFSSKLQQNIIWRNASSELCNVAALSSEVGHNNSSSEKEKKNKAIKLMHHQSVRTIMRLSAHSLPVMLFDLMQGHSGVRLNGELAHLLFQEEGSSCATCHRTIGVHLYPGPRLGRGHRLSCGRAQASRWRNPKQQKTLIVQQ